MHRIHDQTTRNSEIRLLVLELSGLQVVELTSFFAFHAIARCFWGYEMPTEESVRGLRRLQDQNLQAGLQPQVTLCAPTPQVATVLAEHGLDRCLPVEP